jgi:hypothetical protein
MRGVIDQGATLCGGECGAEESVSHLFFECPKFAGTWYAISKWLGISTTFQNEGLSHLNQFEGLFDKGRVIAGRLCVIWFAGIWSIWRARNDKVFKNKEIILENIHDSVKLCLWNWLRFKTNNMEYNFNQWHVNPRACLGCAN